MVFNPTEVTRWLEQQSGSYWKLLEDLQEELRVIGGQPPATLLMGSVMLGWSFGPAPRPEDEYARVNAGIPKLCELVALGLSGQTSQNQRLHIPHRGKRIYFNGTELVEAYPMHPHDIYVVVAKDPS